MNTTDVGFYHCWKSIVIHVPQLLFLNFPFSVYLNISMMYFRFGRILWFEFCSQDFFALAITFGIANIFSNYKCSAGLKPFSKQWEVNVMEFDYFECTDACVYEWRVIHAWSNHFFHLGGGYILSLQSPSAVQVIKVPKLSKWVTTAWRI